MFQKPKDSNVQGLETTIDQLISRMSTEEEDSEDYTKMVDNLETLYKLKAETQPDRVKLDTIAIVAGNLLGIIIIVGFEKSHVMTSKALSNLLKPR
jgi:hypothetical protein